jgi:hypothetical protein
MSASGRSGGDSALIAALAAGATHEAAAKHAGVSERTVRRRLADTEFRRRVDEARGEALDQAMARLSRAATGAATTLVMLLAKEVPQPCGSERAARSWTPCSAGASRRPWSSGSRGSRPGSM